MPRVKDIDLTDTAVDPENGFAALEAKVEEIQVEAAVEAGLETEHAVAAASPIQMVQTANAAFEPSTSAEPRRPAEAQKLSGYDPTGAVTTLLSAFQESALAAIRFHTETFASFVRVRSPQDFAAAQIACAERALGVYASTLAQVTQAPRALAPSFGAR